MVSKPSGLTDRFWGNGNNSQQLIGDFNGDGLDDIANLQSNGYNWIAFSNGDTYFSTCLSKPSGLTDRFWGNENHSEQLIGDFNGDGLDDIANLTK